MFELKVVGKRITEGRRAKGMTQMALADALGISYQAVSSWENGRTMPDISKLPEISEILDISVDELLGKDSPAVQAALTNDTEITLTPEDIAEAAPILPDDRVEEMVELYYNSNQFTHLIPVLQSRFENPFAMYDKLADFYHEKGYFVHTPARAYRYQVLLEFAQQEDPDGMELYRELAVYDLYLRENAKSRPVFALDEKPYHDQIVEFYQEEEKNRTYLPGYEEYHAKQLQRMTHLEVFSWPVQKKAWELISMLKRGEVPETKTAILFDYQNRDRLTDNARTAVVELPTAADAKSTAGQATAADAEAVAATGKGAAD